MSAADHQENKDRHKMKRKQTRLKNEMQHESKDRRAYALIGDSAFDRRGKEMLAYVRSKRPYGDAISIFCQAVTIKDPGGKPRVQLQCVLLDCGEAVDLKKYVLAKNHGEKGLTLLAAAKLAKP